MGNHFKHSSTMHRLFAAQRRYAARAAAAVACAAPLFAIDRPDPAHMLLMRRTPAPRLFSAIEDAIVPHADADQNIKLFSVRATPLSLWDRAILLVLSALSGAILFPFVLPLLQYNHLEENIVPRLRIGAKKFRWSGDFSS